MHKVRLGLLGAAMALLTLPMFPVTASAQDQERPQRGQRGQGRRGMMGRASLTNIPMEAMEATLKLTDAQKTKIKAIQTKLETDTRSLRGQPGSPPNQENRQKRRQINQQAAQDIQAVLTEEQKGQLPALMAEMGALRMAGIPLDAYGELKLTADQKQKIADLAKSLQAKIRDMSQEDRRSRMGEMVQTVRGEVGGMLTESQKQVVEKHRQNRRGNREGSRRPNNDV